MAAGPRAHRYKRQIKLVRPISRVGDDPKAVAASRRVL
jgi:hypothetical protein